MRSVDAKFLIAEIASGNKKRRREATETIAKFDHDSDVDVSVFVSSLTSTDNDVVFWSVIALEHLGERGSAAIPHLLPLLHHEALFVRQTAVKALAAVGPRDERAKAAVFRYFADLSPFVRREALQACIHLRDLSADQLAHIHAMAADPDEAVSSWSEIALRNIRISEQRRA